eukprot:scaffold150836_cov30-Tisochrysis_lutea.AAC.1
MRHIRGRWRWVRKAWLPSYGSADTIISLRSSTNPSLSSIAASRQSGAHDLTGWMKSELTSRADESSAKRWERRRRARRKLPASSAPPTTVLKSAVPQGEGMAASAIRRV